MNLEKGKVLGVDDYYGDDAKKYRKLIRGMEDVLDDYNYNQLITNILTKDNIYKENVDFLGDRFLDNLVYVKLNGENDDVVILPEGTMKTYDYIVGNNLEQAKIFYSTPYVRNESSEDVFNGKTRAFSQIGFEIFNYPKFESTVEAIKLSSDLIKSSGLKKSTVRVTDKRLFKGFIERFSEEDIKIIKMIIDNSDDNPKTFCQLYRENGGTTKFVEDEMQFFLSLSLEERLSLEYLKKELGNNELSLKGIENLSAIVDEVSDSVDIILLPFMSKSWDACDEVMFDIRCNGYDFAICGGGNLTYDKYKPMATKSGAGIGVTRVFNLIRNL